MPRYVTTLDHDSIFELVGDVIEPDSAIIALIRMAHDAGVTVSDPLVVPSTDESSLALATLTFVAFDATPGDVATLTARYSYDANSGPILYDDYLKLVR